MLEIFVGVHHNSLLDWSLIPGMLLYTVSRLLKKAVMFCHGTLLSQPVAMRPQPSHWAPFVRGQWPCDRDPGEPRPPALILHFRILTSASSSLLLWSYSHFLSRVTSTTPPLRLAKFLSGRVGTAKINPPTLLEKANIGQIVYRWARNRTLIQDIILDLSHLTLSFYHLCAWWNI